MTAHSHLSVLDRSFIESSLNHRVSISSIARSLHRDVSTISKEIKRSFFITRKGSFGKSANNCLHRFSCHRRGLCHLSCVRSDNRCSFCGRCNLNNLCPDYVEEVCSLLLKPPYVCNGCSLNHRCTLNRRLYSSSKAQLRYEATLSNSRKGHNFSPDELDQINRLISPLIKQKQSLSHICKNNPDLLPISERTLYTLVAEHCLDVIDLDLPSKVRYRPRKSKKEIKVDKRCRIGRTYLDYLSFMEHHPDLHTVQIDTVEGKKGSPVLLTVFWESCSLQLAFKRNVNNSRSVTDIFNHLYDILGHDRFCSLFPVILTDNGFEFSNPSAIEQHIITNSDGTKTTIPRTRVFYCDPGSPYQKGACERNHEFIRKFIPKGSPIIISQDEVNLMMNHINSYKRKGLNMKSPLFLFSQLYGEDTVHLLGLDLIEPNDVCLTSDIFQKH